VSRIIKTGSSNAYTVVNEQNFLKFLYNEFGECFTDRITGSNENLVIVSPQATSDIIRHFAWGKKHPLNVFEQQAGLVGHLFKTGDSPKSKFIVVVEYIVPLFPDDRNDVTVKTGNDELTKMYKEIKIINQNADRCENSTLKKYGEYIFLGIAHSHPNELDVFMSGTDLETHREWYPSRNAYGLSMVLNPHRRLKVVFGGPDVIKTECVYCVFPEDYESWIGVKGAQSSTNNGTSDYKPYRDKLEVTEYKLKENPARSEYIIENEVEKTVEKESNCCDEPIKVSDIIISERKNMVEIRKTRRNTNEMLVYAPSYVDGILNPRYKHGPFKFSYEVDMDGNVMNIRSFDQIAHPCVDEKGYIMIPDTVRSPADAWQYVLYILSFAPEFVSRSNRYFEKWYQKKYNKGEVPTFSYTISKTNKE